MMAANDLFDIPTIVRLQALVANFRGGGLLIPDFQRPFVWDDKQRIRLFDSILKGLPVGSLMIWRTTKSVAVKGEMEGFSLPKAPAEGAVRSYVLDGQQRVFTLFAALASKAPVSASGERRWPIYLDLERDQSEENGESRLRLARRDTEPPVTWLPLSAVLDSKRLFAHQRKLEEKHMENLVERVEEVANLIRDYPIALVPILTEDLSLVTQSFQRVNSAGTQMSEAHMLRALTYTESFDLSAQLTDITSELPAGWSGLDEQVLVNILKAISGLSIYRADLEQLKTSVGKNDDLLEKLRRGVEGASRFACDHLNVLGPRGLPYVYQFVALARAVALGADLEANKAALTRWFWATAYGEYFTGQTAGQLRSSFEHVSALCAGGEAIPGDLVRRCETMEVFRIPSVRALLLMYRLAERQGEEGARLMSRGSDAFVQWILKGHAADPANRLLVAPERASDLRRDIFDLDPSHDELRERHVLPPAADPVWGAPTKKRTRPTEAVITAVLDWRRERLRVLDEDFMRSLGLDLDPERPLPA